jgi:fatty-acyl-CoA synthase
MTDIKSIRDIELIEATPLAERDLPNSTYAAIARTARASPESCAIRFIENGENWRAARDSGQTILSRDITYGQLLSSINRTANLFRSLGVGDGDVVSILLPNIPEAYFALWGGEAAGVVNPINYLLDAAEIGEIVQSAGSKVLMIMGDHPGSDIIAKLPMIRSHAPCIQHVVVVGQAPPTAEPCLNFDKAIALQNGDALDFDRIIEPDDIASLFHTGGTTGLPKLAQHTHGNEVYTAWAMNLALKYGSGDYNLVGLPVFHCNAAIGSGLLSFMAGATVLLAGFHGFRSPGIISNMFQLIDHYGVTGFNAVPTIYATLVQIPIDDCDLSTLRLPGCGAAPMPLELFSSFEKKTGIRIGEGYGLTEATVCSTLCPLEADFPRIGSIGVRLPYTQVKAAVIDADGQYVRDCAVDETGNILIAGPAVTPGYTDETKNAGLFVTDHDGVKWVNTGDLARQDADGYFWLTGRSKELIIRGGHNIDPKTIEEVLTAHPAVNMAAAVGRPDSYAGEVPVAYVDTVRETSEAELLEYCKAHIGERAAIPKAIMILDKLPVTGVGKIHKPTLNLMELKGVVERELAKLGKDIADYVVSAEANPKTGNTALVSVSCAIGIDPSITEATVRSALNSYSFPYSLEIGMAELRKQHA